MSVNRLIVLIFFAMLIGLVTPIFNTATVTAVPASTNPGLFHAWFYPEVSRVPTTPSTVATTFINLWIAETDNNNKTYIDRIEVRQPASMPYNITGARVYGFNSTLGGWVDVVGVGDWQITPIIQGGEILGFRIDLINDPAGGLNNASFIDGFNNYTILVVKIALSYYKDPSAALSGVTHNWRVFARWNGGATTDSAFVPHTIDNSEATASLVPASQSIIQTPQTTIPQFYLNVTVSDNLPFTGLNESVYGAYALNGTNINLTQQISLTNLYNESFWNSSIVWNISKTLKNGYAPAVVGDFEPNYNLTGVPPFPDPQPFNGFMTNNASPVNESTEGESGYVWVFVAAFAMVDFYPTNAPGAWDANYTYFNRAVYFGGNLFGDWVDLTVARLVAGAGAPTLGGNALNTVSKIEVRFAVIVFDRTLEYHKDYTNSSILNTNYSVTVSAPFGTAKLLTNTFVLGNIPPMIIDPNKAPVLAFLDPFINVPPFAFLPAFVHASEAAAPIGPAPSHLNYRTWLYRLNWTWAPAFGPDGTFTGDWRVEVRRWNGTFWDLVINSTSVVQVGPWFVFDFSIKPFGTGNYSIHIYLKDATGWGVEGTNSVVFPPLHRYYEFNVTYFMVVYIDGNEFSLWASGPAAWEVFEQNDLIPISVQTFGTKQDGSPLDWSQYNVSINLTLQLPTTPPTATLATTFTLTSPSATTPTYAWWNLTVDSNLDLGNVVGIYNVTAIWWNMTSNMQVDNNFNIPLPPPLEISTFMLKPKILLHFSVYDDEYSTGETVTFFAHVADITFPAPGSGVAGAMVAFDVYRDADGVPMASGFWFTNAQGFVVPSMFGEITFGTEIGDDWPAGLYNVNATAFLNTSMGMWWNSTLMAWVPVFAISTASAADQFSVWVYRDADIQQGFSDVLASISSLSSDVADLANDVANIIDLLNNDVLPALSDIMGELSTLASTVADLQAAVSDLQDAVADLQSTVAALSDIQATLSDIQNSLSALSSQLADVQSALSNLQSSLADLQDSLDSLAASVDDVQAALDALAADVADLQSAVSNLQSAVDDLANAVADVGDAVDSLASDVASGFSDLSSKLDDVSQSVSTAENNLADKIDSVAGDLSGMATASLVLLVVAIAISAVTAFKVFKG